MGVPRNVVVRADSRPQTPMSCATTPLASGRVDRGVCLATMCRYRTLRRQPSAVGRRSRPRMNDPVGRSIGSPGRTPSFDADPLSHFRNRKKDACPARGAVESPRRTARRSPFRQPHEQNVAIERRLGPAVWLILSSPPIEHGRSCGQKTPDARVCGAATPLASGLVDRGCLGDVVPLSHPASPAVCGWRPFAAADE